jgi:hypothetical protein
LRKCFAAQAAGSQPHPSIDHGIRIEGDRHDSLVHQPFGEIDMVGRALSADADVLAEPCRQVLIAMLSSAFTAGVALVEQVGDQARVAVEAERQLGQVVGTDRETVEDAGGTARPAGRWTGSRTS